jgi:hypothetical protein
VISFGLDLQTLYVDYDVISTGWPGWTLADIRNMTHRERKHWLRMMRWKRERQNV